MIPGPKGPEKVIDKVIDDPRKKEPLTKKKEKLDGGTAEALVKVIDTSNGPKKVIEKVIPDIPKKPIVKKK